MVIQNRLVLSPIGRWSNRFAQPRARGIGRWRILVHVLGRQGHDLGHAELRPPQDDDECPVADAGPGPDRAGPDQDPDLGFVQGLGGVLVALVQGLETWGAGTGTGARISPLPMGVQPLPNSATLLRYTLRWLLATRAQKPTGVSSQRAW